MARRHVLRSLTLAFAFLLILTTGVTARSAPGTGAQPLLADHLSGSVTVCGRITAYSPPTPGTAGMVTVAGVVDFADHAFPLADTAVVDARLATLAAGGEWTCLGLTAADDGTVTSATVPLSVRPCGSVATQATGLGVDAGATTLVLDGDAGLVAAATPNLIMYLTAIAGVQSQGVACLDVSLAADGTVSALALDYASNDFAAPIACGSVDGTPVAYRDPASQPYPEGDTVSVDGFTVDADLLHPAFQEALMVALDAGKEVCLLARIVDTEIVEAEVLTRSDPDVCGTLEVRGGLVFVDGVVVPQLISSIEFAEPINASLADACYRATAQVNIAGSDLSLCSTLEALGGRTATIGDVTFHLTVAAQLGERIEVGRRQGIHYFTGNILEPAAGRNVPTINGVELPGCPSFQTPPDGGGTGCPAGSCPSPSPTGLPDTAMNADAQPSVPLAFAALLAFGATLVTCLRLCIGLRAP